MRVAPPQVTWPVMCHRWDQITFIHWRYPAEVVQALLPEPLTVETCDGSAWVGVTPFLMRRVRTPGLPAVPWLSEFPEINVRTYVRDQGGRSGIWFFSLDAARLPAVLAARATYALPYFWSDMAVRADGDRVSYRSRRRWPGRQGARFAAESRLGAPLPDTGYHELVEFLTARYRLFTMIGGRLATAVVEHSPWPLRQAELMRLNQDLSVRVGLPPPAAAPLTHASDGVEVRVGRWRR